ncbi:hypothetical protein [Brevundimonas lutea]|uniref:hypothetical protein n=1 Tax=Brevundimonas lutea TaxID=2293980 RepID=UPI000F0449AC|nr:hypothetical protein [Brevundimonas lutea]
MSCGLLIAAALLVTDPSVADAHAGHAAAATAPAAPPSVATEPLFANIVSRSETLRAIVDGWMEAAAAPDAGEFAAFKAQTVELAARDMEGHVDLRERGVDGDLKCILKGIAEDMPLKVAAVEGAADDAARQSALSELRYLLNDNVEVITSPPTPAA